MINMIRKGLVGLLVAGAGVGGYLTAEDKPQDKVRSGVSRQEDKGPRFLSYENIPIIPDVLKRDDSWNLFPNAKGVGYDSVKRQFYVDGLLMKQGGMFLKPRGSNLYVLVDGETPKNLEGEDWISLGNKKDYTLKVSADGDANEPQLILDGTSPYIGRKDGKEHLIFRFPRDNLESTLKIKQGYVDVKGNVQILNGDLLIDYSGKGDIPKIRKVDSFDFEIDGKTIHEKVAGNEVIPMKFRFGKTVLEVLANGSYQFN